MKRLLLAFMLSLAALPALADTKFSAFNSTTFNTSTDKAVGWRSGAPNTNITFSLAPSAITDATNFANDSGTISSGLWNGTVIGTTYGGLGANESAATGVVQLSSGTTSVSTALVNGTTGTTQSASSNDTKVATDAYVDRANLRQRNMTFTFNGSGSAPSANSKAILPRVPCAGTITSVTLISDASGSAVIDLWKLPYASGVPTVANTITASDLPTLSSAQQYTDSTLTGWTTAVADTDQIIAILNSASTLTIAALNVRMTCN